MKIVLEAATNKAVQELKELAGQARETFLAALNEKVGKLSHAEEQEVLALVLKPANEQTTGYVTKRVKVIIDELVKGAANKAKPAKQKQPAKQPATLINTNKAEK